MIRKALLNELRVTQAKVLDVDFAVKIDTQFVRDPRPRYVSFLIFVNNEDTSVPIFVLPKKINNVRRLPEIKSRLEIVSIVSTPSHCIEDEIF